MYIVYNLVMLLWFTVEHGLRQECNLSPDLFARYANRIMKMVKKLDGIHIGGININNMLYADNTTLVADSEANFRTYSMLLFVSEMTYTVLSAWTLNSTIPYHTMLLLWKVNRMVCPSTGKNRCVWLYQNH